MNFSKLEGCANDFIVTQDIAEGRIPQIAVRTPKICDRRTGIGGDGLICVLPSATCDYKMRIINADGSEPEMCGNGIRCFAVYLQRMGLTAKQSLTIETKAGVIGVEYKDSLIRVNMGTPILNGRMVPVNADGNLVLEHALTIDGRTFLVNAVSMGNPHAVIFVNELTDDLVHSWGSKIEVNPFFPRKTNVEFIHVVSPSEVNMRVWERGCGETQACGTGACASMVAGVLTKRNGNSVTVHLLGGDLLVEWDGDPAHPVFMTGPAKHVFDGVVEIE